MSSSLGLDRLYQWATMTPVNLLASLVLAVIGLVVLLYVLLGVLWLFGSLFDRITPEAPSAPRDSRETQAGEWLFWAVFFGVVGLGVLIVFGVSIVSVVSP